MSGGSIKDDRSGLTYSYNHKSIIQTDIILPPQASKMFLDANYLSNKMESSESKSNARVCRTFDIALPSELSVDDNIEIAKRISQVLADEGMIVQYAVHPSDPKLTLEDTLKKNRDTTYQVKDNSKNIHLHLMTTTRNVDGEELTTKNRDWNKVSSLESWRKAVADIQNEFLEKRGLSERVDHRSFEKRGIEIIPLSYMTRADILLEESGILTEEGTERHETMSINEETLRQEKEQRKINVLKRSASREQEHLKVLEDKLAVIESNVSEDIRVLADDSKSQSEDHDITERSTQRRKSGENRIKPELSSAALEVLGLSKRAKARRDNNNGLRASDNKVSRHKDKGKEP